MPNMSYCRFENTSADLADCITAMEEVESVAEMDLSEYELDALKRMERQCQEFFEHIERLGLNVTSD